MTDIYNSQWELIDEQHVRYRPTGIDSEYSIKISETYKMKLEHGYLIRVVEFGDGEALAASMIFVPTIAPVQAQVNLNRMG